MSLLYSALIADFQNFYNARRGYIPGTSGETWTQDKQNKKALTDKQVAKYGQQWVGRKVDDCSGAFVDAYRQHGLSIYHGSNRIARVYVVALLPISQAKPGMAAFKCRKPGAEYYDLPSEYRVGGKHYNGDLNDYYHIGLIDSDPNYVINSQSTAKGFQRSKITENWSACGYLKAVTYEDEGGNEPMNDVPYMATVYAENGKPVNLRIGPSAKAGLVNTVSVGTEVTVVEEVDGEWAKVKTKKNTGYMMRKFLTVEDEPADDTAPDMPPAEDQEVIVNKLLQAQALIADVLTMLGGAVG